MAGHAQLKFVMTECSKTQIRLTGLMFELFVSYLDVNLKVSLLIENTLENIENIHFKQNFDSDKTM